MTHEHFGIVAGGVSAADFLVYIVAMIWGKNSPNRMSWFIWGVIGGILYFGHQEAGGHASGWVPLMHFVMVGLIFILSLKWGEGGWNKLDVGCLIAAIVVVILWQVFDATWIALTLVIADGVGFTPTIRKACCDPQSESRLAWILSVVANIINLFAIANWRSLEVVYPIYLLVLTGVMMGILLRPRSKIVQG